MPLFFIIAVFIKIDSKGPVFFKQKRGGLYGEHFYIYKFRTMVKNAEKRGMKYKTEVNDPRITRIGDFLRKYSLDELPQLINVLKGDMSLVGPRPALVIQTDNYDQRQKKRLEMKPGITGYAQINGRNDLTWDEKIAYDLEYIKNHSLILDFKILFKTFFKIFDTEKIYVSKGNDDNDEKP